jgi:hypothetical protein
MPTDRGTTRGDLLSCYTASIAEYMAGAGIEPELPIGTQAYLAVRRSGTGICEFVQFHTPLRGDAPTHSLHLRRRHTTDPAEARARIAAEVARSGRAIVVGDTFNVPWQVAHQKSHAPHWFVADGLDDGTAVHVTDRFEFVNDAGEQRPYDGWIGLDQIASLATANPDPNPVYVMRDRYAFADAEDPAGIATGGYQWYELDGEPHATKPDARSALARLAATHAAGRAGTSPRTGGDDGWIAGPDAAGLLAEHIEAGIGEPVTYDNSDDIWVTARNRQLFAETLTSLGRRWGLPPLAELGAWAEAEVAKPWAAIPQLMQYNQRSLARGRTPRPLIVEQLRAAATAERALYERLGEILDSLPPDGGRRSGPQSAPPAT